VNQKGANAFRITADAGVPLEQCLAECTAIVNCVGISHEVGRIIFVFGAELQQLSGMFSSGFVGVGSCTIIEGCLEN
jgi:hypothetical protein